MCLLTKMPKACTRVLSLRPSRSGCVTRCPAHGTQAPRVLTGARHLGRVQRAPAMNHHTNWSREREQHHTMMKLLELSGLPLPTMQRRQRRRKSYSRVVSRSSREQTRQRPPRSSTNCMTMSYLFEKQHNKTKKTTQKKQTQSTSRLRTSTSKFPPLLTTIN